MKKAILTAAILSVLPFSSIAQDNENRTFYAHDYTKDGKVIVENSNFTIAETDLYMSDLAKEVPVNTFRHSRQLSTKDHQFVVRENQDVMYSHAVVDVSEGATIINPAWDVYSAVEVFDENQYTIAVIYPGQQKTFTPKDLALGTHIFLNMRTAVRSFDKKGYDEAHKHQDAVVIDAKSKKPYIAKEFDRSSQDSIRATLKARIAEITSTQYAFGTRKEVQENPTIFLISSAVGIFGLPLKDAAYITQIQPSSELKSGVCSSLTLPVPPLQFNKGGFFSVTTYDENGWIAKDNYALSNRQAKPNEDGTYTFRFNCPGKQNNIDVVPNWNSIIRLYRPNTEKDILDYMNKAVANVKIVKE